MLTRYAQEHWEDAIDRIRRERAFSPWLKLQLGRALELPPEQAARDAALLATVLRQRLIQEAAGANGPLGPVRLPADDPLATREAWERRVAVTKSQRRDAGTAPRERSPDDQGRPGLVLLSSTPGSREPRDSHPRAPSVALGRRTALSRLRSA